jgi:hypothetical protein
MEFVLFFFGFLAYYSNLRTEAIYSSEATIDLSRITRCYRPEDKLFMAISAITSNIKRLGNCSYSYRKYIPSRLE